MTPLNILEQRLKEIEPIMHEAINNGLHEADDLIDLYNQYLAAIKLIRHHIRKRQCKTKFQPLLRDEKYIKKLREDKLKVHRLLSSCRIRNKEYLKRIRILKAANKKHVRRIYYLKQKLKQYERNRTETDNYSI